MSLHPERCHNRRHRTAVRHQRHHLCDRRFVRGTAMEHRSRPRSKRLATDRAAVARRRAGMDTDVPCVASSPCGAVGSGAEYLSRVHGLSFSTKKSLLNSRFSASSPYATVPQTPTVWPFVSVYHDYEEVDVTCPPKPEPVILRVFPRREAKGSTINADEPVQRGANPRHPQACRGGAEGGRGLPRGGQQRADVLPLEGEVRRGGGEPVAAVAAIGGGERAAEADRRRSDAGQRRPEGRADKNR